MPIITFEQFTQNCLRLLVKPEDKAGRLLHAAVGLATEAGELLDAYKKAWIYNKPLDKENLIEECGDLLFYLCVGASLAGASIEGIANANAPSTPFAVEQRSIGIGRELASILFHSSSAVLRASQFYYANCRPSQLEELQCTFTGEGLRIFGVVKELARFNGFTLQDVFQHNFDKLNVKRYPDGYSDAAAIARADKQIAAVERPHLSVKCSSRRTVMSGEVVTFAPDFLPVHSVLSTGYEARGAFEVSASRERVIVHHADLKTQEDFNGFAYAMRCAREAYTLLSPQTCGGEPSLYDKDPHAARLRKSAEVVVNED